ncbi:MAG: ABC transporter ATP-binding protein, partial [Bacilli bacterium]
MKKIIEITNVSKHFKKVKALDQVSLTIEKQDIFGFIGPNGAGKSTLIRTMVGLLFADEGKIIINEIDVSKESYLSNAMIGYMPSDVNYPDVLVKELINYNKTFYKDIDDNYLETLIKTLGLDITKKTSQLSLGNLKKLSIVLALMHQPSLLILDEPTSGLDPLVMQSFFKLLYKANERGCTIFFSSHNLEEVNRLCNKVAFIKQGQIIQVSTIEQLKENTYQKISIDTNNQLDINQLNQQDYKSYYHEGNIYSFLYHGNINTLLCFLNNYELNKLLIETLTLEEIFLHYY